MKSTILPTNRQKKGKGRLESWLFIPLLPYYSFQRGISNYVQIKELEAEEKEFELFTKKVEFGIGLAERLDSDAARNTLAKRVEMELGIFLMVHPQSPEVQEAKRRIMLEKIKMHNKTLERDQAYCAAFSEVPGSGKFNFLSEVLGFKSLAPQLPVIQS